MESWLKFRAPGVTLSVGLGIGRLVFAALNKIELVLAVAIMVCYLFHWQHPGKSFLFWLAIPCCLLIIQTLWLLPALDTRAAIIISGKEISPSPLHIWFIIAEFVKVISLVVIGWHFFKITFTK